MGFAYIVSVVSLFDEYVNDLLYLREGSCLPRCYRHFFHRAYILLLLTINASSTLFYTSFQYSLYYKVKFVSVHLINVILVFKEGPT